MRLTINGKPCEFVKIKAFRTAYNLPHTFGVAFFEPKYYTGLGRIDQAGSDLNTLRRAVLSAVPLRLTLPRCAALLAELETLFQRQLEKINPRIGLKTVELEFAVAGFADVCQALLYALLRASQARTEPPSFQRVYAEWLDSTVRVSHRVHTYHHHGEGWRVRMVNHVYGRIGLIIHTRRATHYVRDGALACPAEGFMFNLLDDLAERLTTALD